jgi:hypothetical protein
MKKQRDVQVFLHIPIDPARGQYLASLQPATYLCPLAGSRNFTKLVKNFRMIIGQVFDSLSAQRPP